MCLYVGVSIHGAHMKEELAVEAVKVVWFLFFSLFL